MSKANGPTVRGQGSSTESVVGLAGLITRKWSFRRAHVLDTRHCPMLLPGKQVEDACHIDVVHADACHIDVVHVAT